MSQEEQDQILGRLFREYRESTQRLALLDYRVSDLSDHLSRLVSLLRGSSNEGSIEIALQVVPDKEEISKIWMEYAIEKTKNAEFQDRLNLFGISQA